MIFSSLTDFFQIHDKLAYLVLFIGSYFETLIGPGFFIYGEFFFLPGAILAGLGYLNIWLVAIACIAGGLLGDTSSFFIGKRYGYHAVNFFFKKSNKYLNPKNYKKAKDFFQKRGKKAIFFSRFMGPLAWIVPFIAGTFRIKYKDFLKYNIPGVTGGIGVYLIAGYFFGYSYTIFLGKAQQYIWFILLAFIVILVYLIEREFSIFKKIKKYMRNN